MFAFLGDDRAGLQAVVVSAEPLARTTACVPFSLLESVIDVSSTHKNSEQTSGKDVLQPEANAEGH